MALHSPLPPSPIASISLVNKQILHPSPTRSLSNRAVVTFGPTVRPVVGPGDNSSIVGPVGLDESAPESESEPDSARTWER